MIVSVEKANVVHIKRHFLARNPSVTNKRQTIENTKENVAARHEKYRLLIQFVNSFRRNSFPESDMGEIPNRKWVHYVQTCGICGYKN